MLRQWAATGIPALFSRAQRGEMSGSCWAATSASRMRSGLSDDPEISDWLPLDANLPPAELPIEPFATTPCLPTLRGRSGCSTCAAVDQGRGSAVTATNVVSNENLQHERAGCR